mgnify:CR=1 FL=1
MTKILTAEQVENIKLTSPLTPWSHSNRVTLSQLCASHKALQVQVENLSAAYEHELERLADAQEDVRALTEAHEGLYPVHLTTWADTISREQRHESSLTAYLRRMALVMDRPGVRRVEEGQIQGHMDGAGHFVPDMTHSGTQDYVEHLREEKL